jgi:hypothetical protein
MKFASKAVLNCLKYSGYYITISALTLECYIFVNKTICRYSSGSQKKECLFDYRIDRITFAILIQHYCCKVRTGILNITQMNFLLQKVEQSAYLNSSERLTKIAHAMHTH